MIGYHVSAAKVIVQALYQGVSHIGAFLRLPVIAVTLVLLPALYEAAKKSAYSFAHPWLAGALGVTACVG